MKYNSDSDKLLVYYFVMYIFPMLVCVLHSHYTLDGVLLASVEVGGEVGEVRLGGKVPDEGD